MPDYQVAYHAPTKVATVQFRGDLRPAGASASGNFAATVGQGAYGRTEKKVFYQFVREALETQGIKNMQFVKINLDEVYVALTSILVSPATSNRNVAQTVQLSVALTPAGASNPNVVWTTSHPARATVSPTGLVTAVGSGVAVITATSEDGARTSTCTVTVA
jgi:uncharacterized protein YjdB